MKKTAAKKIQNQNFLISLYHFNNDVPMSTYKTSSV